MLLSVCSILKNSMSDNGLPSLKTQINLKKSCRQHFKTTNRLQKTIIENCLKTN